MTQQFQPSQSPDERDPVESRQGVDDDAIVASLLADAYDAPPVPPSLARRIDDGFSEHWGVSPGLAPARPNAVSAVTQAVVRVWPVVAGLAAVLTLAFFLLGGSSGYAWATVIDALRDRGMVRIQTASSTRWVDLSHQVAGQQTDASVQWVDLIESTVTTRSLSSGEVTVERLAKGSEASQSGALLAAVLCADDLSAKSIRRFQKVKVLDQQWSPVSSLDQAVVDLNLQLMTEADGIFRVTLRLDSDSGLPLSVDASAQRSESMALLVNASIDYPSESVTQWKTRQLVGGGLASNATDVSHSDRFAARDESTRGETQSGSESSNAAASLSDVRGPEEPGTNAFVSLPVGAANEWGAVEVLSRTESDVLERVNENLVALWRRENVQPVAKASDQQLLRRAYLDLAGRIPTVTEVRAFLNDSRADRYERLIDQLLESPDHASQMAAVWRSFLIPEGVDLETFGGREAFEKWLADRFSADASYDQIVRELLLAEGRLTQSGPLLFYSALKLDAHQLAARTSRVFLGMRLECAQCHDHPFEPWSQQDFWSFAAFFARISRPKGELEMVSRVMRVQDVDRGEVMLPDTEIVVAPRFLGRSQAIPERSQAIPERSQGVPETSRADSDAGASTSQARRQQLARWLTGPENPYFARATVNRIWSQLFGRGIVDPVDDFGANNPPVSPELLDTLASQFIDSGFDLKQLVRTITLSDAYRLSSRSADQTDGDGDGAAGDRLRTFAQMNVKTLTAEQLYDCIAVATLLGQGNQVAADSYTLARFGNGQRDAFLQQFATPVTSRSEYMAGIPQALMLMNGGLTHGATSETSSGLIRSLQAPFFSDRQRIDVLFMATLSRVARPDEHNLFSEFIAKDATAQERSSAMSDLLWALINSSEFTFNH